MSLDDRHTFDLNSAGAGPLKCAYDYIQLNGIRFCGRKFNPLGIYQNIFIDAPVTGNQLRPRILFSCINWLIYLKKRHK